MADRLLIDTDVLIDYLRGQRDAVAYLDGLHEELLISAITVAEQRHIVEVGLDASSFHTTRRTC